MRSSAANRLVKNQKALLYPTSPRSSHLMLAFIIWLFAHQIKCPDLSACTHLFGALRKAIATRNVSLPLFSLGAPRKAHLQLVKYAYLSAVDARRRQMVVSTILYWKLRASSRRIMGTSSR